MDSSKVRCSEACLDIIESQRSTEPTGNTKPMFKFSDLYNHPGVSVSMNSEISSSMRAGNIKFLEKMKNYKTPMACFKNNKGDTILHLAAASGHLELVRSIIYEYPSLLLEPNWKDQLPLHVAASAGHSMIIEILVVLVTSFSDKLAEEKRERLNLYALKDKDGNTPLHLALKNLYDKPKVNTAACLVSANQHVSFLANEDRVSPLYLAVEDGNILIVKAMLNIPEIKGETFDLATKLEGKKSLVHAALKGKNIDVLDFILNKFPDIVKVRDEEGRTCLSVGASVGFHEGICKLLETSTLSIFDCDDDGSFPIHRAVEKCHKDVVMEFLKRFPDSVEQVNKEGQNIFHIVAKSGKTTLGFRKYIKKVAKTKGHLLEEQDVDGNTPLHLATINWRPKVVSILTRNVSRKVLDMKNSHGLRALDIAEINLQSNYVFRERMTLMLLLSLYNQRRRRISMVPTSGMTLRNRSERLGGRGEKYKDRVSILLLVATLVTTMTFAAGFTMPGGFGSSAPNAGMAILVNDSNLSLFIIFDTIAMLTSVLAIVALIWAQLGDEELAHKAFNLALPALLVALICMSSAFLSGIVATIQHNIVLKNILSYVGGIFVTGTIYLLLPYVIPQVYGLPVIQEITEFYLCILVLFVNEEENEKHNPIGSYHTCGNKVESLGSSSGGGQVDKPKLV